MSTGVLGAIPWDDGDLTIGALLVGRCVIPAAVSASRTDEPVVVRWCGPAEAMGSGCTAAVPLPGEPTSSQAVAAHFESRISAVTWTRDLGSLEASVMVLSSLSVSLDVGGTEDGRSAVGGAWSAYPARPMFDHRTGGFATDVLAAEGFRWLLQRARWADQPVDLYLCRLDDEGRPVQCQIAGRYVWDRDPSALEIAAGRMSARGAIVGLDERWPVYEWPSAPSWPGFAGPGARAKASGTSAPYVDGYHPGTGNPYSAAQDYLVQNMDKGATVGLWYGSATSTNYTWRRCPIYGTNAWPGQPADAFVFLYLGPQTDIYARAVYWYQPSTGQVRSVAQIDDGGTYVCETFENLDPTRGPLGACVVLRVRASEVDSPYNITDEQIFLARCEGPGSGVTWVTHENARIMRSGTPLASRDETILKDVFEQLGHPPSVWGGGAFSDLAADSPLMFASSNVFGWREFHCAVPRQIQGDPPSVRRVLGELLKIVQADLVQKYDPTTGDLALYPVRRRPNPAAPFDPTRPDHRTVREADLADHHGGVLLRWQIDPDDASYANQYRRRSPAYLTLPDTTEDVLEIERTDRVFFDLPAEQGPDARNAIVRKEDGATWWVHETDTTGSAPTGGLVDAGDLWARTRAQQGWVTEAPLGPHALGWDLGDCILYDVPGMHLGAGHIRQIRGTVGATVQVVVRANHRLFLARAGQDLKEQ
jgi:hypothetical protein